MKTKQKEALECQQRISNEYHVRSRISREILAETRLRFHNLVVIGSQSGSSSLAIWTTELTGILSSTKLLLLGGFLCLNPLQSPSVEVGTVRLGIQ